MLHLPPLHRLVQLAVREGQVTSKGLSHIILPHLEGGGGSDGSRSLVPVGREGFGGHGDYLRCHEDQTSYI